jgi:molybdopterin synthase catalytic subunit
MIDLNRMIETAKANPRFHKAGMIASHLGIVRSFSRDGAAVSGIDVEFDHERIEEIMRDIKSRPGIVDILIETNNGHLGVGDEIMAVVVAGDIRDRVFPALIDAVDRVKSEASTKKEAVID